MESKRLLFLSSLLIFSLISSDAKPMVGGYEPIEDLNDPYVVEIANFAVSEHNKKVMSPQLVFVKVVSGEQQVVAGTNYKLNINAKAPAVAGGQNGDVYEAVVYDKPWQKYRSLTSFNKV